MVVMLKFFGQLACAFGRPSQRRFRMPPGYRIDQSIQSLQQPWINFRQRFATAPDTAKTRNDRVIRMCLTMLQFTETSRNRIPRESGGGRDSCDTAPTEGRGFGGSPLSTHTLVHYRRQSLEFLPYPFDRWSVLHAATIVERSNSYNTNLLKLFFRGSLGTKSRSR